MYMSNIGKNAIAAGLTTGVKSIFALATIAGVKAMQSINSLSDEGLQQFMANAEKFYLDSKTAILETCTSPQYKNINQKLIIQQLICEDNSNKLKVGTLFTLAGILNDNNFYAVPRKAYDKEKEAAQNALTRGAVGVAVSSAAVDATIATSKDSTNSALKSFNKLISQTPPKPTNDPGMAFGRSLITAPISIAAAYGVTRAGIEMYKRINTVIPAKYKPDMNKLTTSLADKKKLFKNNELAYNKCVTETMMDEIKLIENRFKDNQSEDDQSQDVISNYTSDVIEKPMDIYKIDFDFGQYILSTGYKGKTKRNQFKDQIKNYCNKTLPVAVKDLKIEIDKLEKLIETLFNAYKIPGNEAEGYIKNLSSNVTPIINDLILDKITSAELEESIENINNAIVEAENAARANTEAGIFDRNVPGTKMVVAASQTMEAAAKNIGSFFTRRKGGRKKTQRKRKSRKLRKRKTQRRKLKTQRRR